jgi:hypothetical protein
VQVHVREQRRDDTALRRADVRVTDQPALHDPGLEPLVDRASHDAVTHPLVENPTETSVVQMVEEAGDVQFQDPPATHRHQPLPELFERHVC